MAFCLKPPTFLLSPKELPVCTVCCCSSLSVLLYLLIYFFPSTALEFFKNETQCGNLLELINKVTPLLISCSMNPGVLSAEKL